MVLELKKRTKGVVPGPFVLSWSKDKRALAVCPRHPRIRPSVNPGQTVGALLFAVLLAVALSACSQQPTATPMPSPTPVDPKAELRRTVERLLELASVSFVLEQTVGTTVLSPGIEMNRAYGTVIVPGKFDVTVEAQVANLYVELGMASIDGVSYMTNPITGQWAVVPAESIPINLLTIGSTLAGIVEAVQSPELLGKSALDDVDVYHIRGSILSEDLLELVPGADEGYPVMLEMWMEQQSGTLRKATITGRVTDDDVPDALRVLTLDNINQPVTIEPPPGF